MLGDETGTILAADPDMDIYGVGLGDCYYGHIWGRPRRANRHWGRPGSIGASVDRKVVEHRLGPAGGTGTGTPGPGHP